MKILLILALFAVGCASTHNNHSVYIDSMVLERPTPGSKVYIADKTESSALEKQYFESQVKTAFKNAGFVVVDLPSDSNIFVYFNYSLNKEVKIKSKPILAFDQPKSYSYSETGPGGTVSGNVHETSGGKMRLLGHRKTESTDYTPTIQFVCYDKEKVIKNFGTNKNVSMWEMKIFTEDDAENMKEIFPALIKAGELHFANPQDRKIKEKISIPKS